jgi:hypothetical protein
MLGRSKSDAGAENGTPEIGSGGERPIELLADPVMHGSVVPISARNTVSASTDSD